VARRQPRKARLAIQSSHPRRRRGLMSLARLCRNAVQRVKSEANDQIAGGVAGLHGRILNVRASCGAWLATGRTSGSRASWIGNVLRARCSHFRPMMRTGATGTFADVAEFVAAVAAAKAPILPPRLRGAWHLRLNRMFSVCPASTELMPLRPAPGIRRIHEQSSSSRPSAARSAESLAIRRLFTWIRSRSARYVQCAA
jgi:hypothetical protein